MEEEPQDKEKEIGSTRSRKFPAGRRKELGSLNCRDLIGLTLNTDEAMKIYREKNLRKMSPDNRAGEKLAQTYLSSIKLNTFPDKKKLKGESSVYRVKSSSYISL